MLTFFQKLLSALNSAQKPYQISLALSLGLISGFLPFFTPLNFIVLFFVFAINIPLGLYFASVVVFGLIGYFLDPIFAHFGEYLLALPSLQSLYTDLYNNPVAIWTSFNHTVVLGSLSLALPLAIISFFALKPFVPKLRQVLEKISSFSKLLSWLNPHKEKTLKKKSPLFRWWGALGFVAVTALLASFFLLVLDPVLKFALEKGVSFVSGHDVQIKSLQTKLKDLSLQIKDINVYKDKKELSIKDISLALDPKHTLEKKLDFKQIIVQDLNLDPKQDKPLKTAIKTQESQKKAQGFKLPNFNLPSVDEILKKEDIKSLAIFKDASQQAKDLQEKYKQINKAYLNTNKLKEFEARFKALEKRKITDIKTATALANDAKSLYNDINTYKQELENLKQDLEKDSKAIKTTSTALSTLPQQEFNRLVNKYSTFQDAGLNLISTYISPKIAHYIKQGLKYYEKLKPYIKSNDKPQEKKPRLKGRFVHFKSLYPYPSKYLQKLSANVIAKEISYDLIAKDITNNQNILNKPSTASLTTKSKEFSHFKANAVFDDRQKQNKLSLDLIANGLQKTNLINSSDFALEKAQINTKAALDLTSYTDIKGNINLDFTNAKMALKDTSTKLNKLINQTLKNITNFDINIALNGKIYLPKINANSNLDKQLSNQFSKTLNAQKKAFEKELKQRLEKEIKTLIKSTNLDPKILKVASDALNGKTTSLENIKQDLQKKYSQEALEKQLKAKATKAIKNELKKGLGKEFKDLF